MKVNRLTYAALAVLLVAALWGCSTKKNTWATRSFHYTTSRYNINFNAKANYEKGIEQMQKSMQDDYSQLLPMYPISVHENGTAVGSTMDLVIEKCRKTIKLHSITHKPKKNQKRAKNANYQQWLKKVEFNPQVLKAWLLVGYAEFQKADFIGAVGTFTYIIKHYSNEAAIVTEARIMLARAYAEMQWYYEAEEVLGKVNENDVPRDLNGLYAATMADLLLKEEKHTEAVPFLKIALEKEKNRYQRVRFNYILGQLALEQNDLPLAQTYFKEVVKHAPNYTMEFNARMQMLTAETKDLPKAIKQLGKMAKNPNNKEYLDQIYYAIGNIYLNDNQVDNAIQAYQEAIKESTRNGIEKAVVLLTLGDLYYDNKQYIEAHPCYEEAATIISNTHNDYDRVVVLAETLGELAQNYNVVVLQDSLQALSRLPEDKQRAVVDKIIAQVIADEEATRQQAEDDAAMLAASADADFGGFTPPGAMRTAGEWYFYNSQLISSGKAQFKQRWGNRKLEDNWRRLNKSAQFADITADNDNIDEQETENDSTQQTIDDNKNPQFYLAQIPKTEEQIAQSNAEIAEALLAMADIYERNLDDSEAAETALKEYEQRFPHGDRLLDCYYAQYKVYGHMQREPERAAVRQKIIEEFPDSKQAIILSQPDYAERVAHMYAMQDSLYQATYAHYSASRFADVLNAYHFMAANYPLSTLMPKFALLRALSLGKTAPPDTLQTALAELIERYPLSDVASVAKDILALMSQGKEAQKGTAGSLAELRQQEVEAEAAEPVTEKTFTPEKNTTFALLLQTDGEQSQNRILYDIAAYNFSKFLIKDYDMAARTIDGTKFVVLSNFENYAEVTWYIKLAQTDENLQRVFDQCVQILPVSDDNLQLLPLLGTAAYQQFYHETFK